MRLVLMLFAIALTAAAIPPPSNDKVQVLKYENDNPGFGGYRYQYEQSDGTKAEQYGEVKNEGLEDETSVVRGSFTWIGPDGVKYTVTYVADEDGYQPEIEQGPGGAISPGVLASLAGG